MKEFTYQAACFAALQVAIAAIVLCFYRVDESAYLAATRDKHAFLETQPSPRVIFVGGSNLAFGVDSSIVARDTPFRPVNLALHAGMGLRFMLREVEETLRPGDLVVLSIEYQHFTGHQVDMLLQLLEQRPRSARLIPVEYVPALLDQGLNHLASTVRGALRTMLGRPIQRREAPYVRHAFNRYGDVVAHWRLPPPSRLKEFRFGAYSLSSIVSTVRSLNRFQERARAKGAGVLFLYPTIPGSTFVRHRQVIGEIDGVIKESLKIPVLNRPEDATLPIEFFYDTHYHLREVGARQRTRLLVARLQREQGVPPHP